MVLNNFDLPDLNLKEEKIIYIEPEKIKRSKYQPRRIEDKKSFEELKESIKEHGILQPLIVTKIKDKETPYLYELIAGERRLKAAEEIGLKKVPVIVRSLPEQQKLEWALIENIQRKDLNPLDQAQAFKRLIEEFNLTQEEVAQKVGKSRSEVANILRLLKLPPKIQEALAQEKITYSQARTILSLNKPEEKIKLFQKVIRQDLSVRETEKAVRLSSKKKKTSPELLSLEERLREFLGTKVNIDFKKGKGKILIYFFSLKELKDLLRKILKLT